MKTIKLTNEYGFPAIFITSHITHMNTVPTGTMVHTTGGIGTLVSNTMEFILEQLIETYSMDKEVVEKESTKSEQKGTKYKLGEKHETLNLFRVVALRNIGDNVKSGDVGGWVESEKNLSQFGECWVYGDACVSGDARVSGTARVSGDARVWGTARVSGDARVYGNACVYDNACVYGNAWVAGTASVYGNAYVYGDACVSGNACVYDNARVLGTARVYGNAWVYGDACVYGNAWVYGDARVSGDVRVSGTARVSDRSHVNQ